LKFDVLKFRISTRVNPENCSRCNHQKNLKPQRISAKPFYSHEEDLRYYDEYCISIFQPLD
jgi:hypothetical protein